MGEQRITTNPQQHPSPAKPSVRLRLPEGSARRVFQHSIWGPTLLYTIVPALLMLGLVTGTMYWITLPAIEKNHFESHRNGLEHLGDIALRLVQTIHGQVAAGTLSEQEAKAHALRELRALRYGEKGQEYFWVHSTRGEMLMHPYRPDLEGRDLSSYSDEFGTNIIALSREVTKKNGAGFIEYQWQVHDRPQELAKKVSYIVLFEPWQWVIGTGLYLEKTRAHVKSVVRQTAWGLLFSLCAMTLAIVFIVWSARRREERRVTALTSLAQSEEQLSLAIQAAHAAPWEYNLKTQELFISPLLAEVLHVTMENFPKLEGKQMLEFVHPADRKKLRQEWVAFLKRKTEALHVSFRVAKESPDQWQWLSTQGRFMNASEVYGEKIIGIVRDSHQEKTDLLKLTQQQAALDQASDGIAIANLSGHILYQNFSWKAMHQRLKGDNSCCTNLRDHQHQELWENNLEPLFKKALQEGYAGGDISLGGQRQHRGFFFEVNITLIRNELQEPINVVIISRDLTEKKQIEAQMNRTQRLEVLGELAGGAAHDFNNVLSPIVGYAEILKRRTEKLPELYRYAESIQKAAQLGKELTSRLLLFGRSESLPTSCIDLCALLHDLKDIIRHSLRHDIRYKLTLPDHPLYIKADSSKLAQVFINLAVNARHAMPEGGTFSITASLSQASGEERRVLVKVSDTGQGMTKEVKERSFEPFFTTKEPGKGTGLGLSTSYGILKEFGAHIELESELGKGTTFLLSFPLAETSQPSPRA